MSSIINTNNEISTNDLRDTVMATMNEIMGDSDWTIETVSMFSADDTVRVSSGRASWTFNANGDGIWVTGYADGEAAATGFWGLDGFGSPDGEEPQQMTSIVLISRVVSMTTEALD